MNSKVVDVICCEFCYLKPSDDPDSGFAVIDVPDVGQIALCGSCRAAFEYGRAHPDFQADWLERNEDGDFVREVQDDTFSD